MWNEGEEETILTRERRRYFFEPNHAGVDGLNNLNRSIGQKFKHFSILHRPNI